MNKNLIKYYAHEYDTGVKDRVKSAKKALRAYDKYKHLELLKNADKKA